MQRCGGDNVGVCQAQLCDWGERLSMVRRQPVGRESGMMFRRPVPGIGFPAIMGMPSRERAHQPIAGHLGDDRRAGDRVAAGVAANDGCVFHTQGPDGITVDHHVVELHVEIRERTAHGQHRGVVNVDAVDLAHGGRPDPHTEGSLEDACRERLPLSAREFLGIVHAANGASVGGHHDGACDDGARERAPSDFIDSGQQGTSRRSQRSLERAPARQGPAPT